MTNAEELQNIIGRTAVDRDGKKVGKIGRVYLDDDSGSPRWVTISTGLFGSTESFAPIKGYCFDGDNVVLYVTKEQVKNAPNVDADGHLDDDENGRLHTYYGASFAGRSTGDDTSGPTIDAPMTLSREPVGVSTEGAERAPARPNKYVVTENVSVTVPVSHDEVRVEREPIRNDNASVHASTPEIGEEEREVILHSEQPVVHKETVAVERFGPSTA